MFCSCLGAPSSAFSSNVLDDLALKTQTTAGLSALTHAHASGLLSPASIGSKLSSYHLPTDESGAPDAALLRSRSFNVWDYDEDQLVVFAMRIIQELDLLTPFGISEDTLKLFFIAVRSRYRRANAFHCWAHGFSVMQFAYVMIHSTQGRALAVLSKLDLLALLVASLCHDVDHPGMCGDDERVAMCLDICMLCAVVLITSSVCRSAQATPTRSKSTPKRGWR
jgi:hypothetical protein